MFTWEKIAFVSWRTGIYVFFPDIYVYFPGKYAYNFGFKIDELQKFQKWCNYVHLEKNRSKSRNLSNEHLFVLFRGYRYLGICCQAQTLGWAVLITVLRNGYVAGLESADFSVFKTREGVLNPFTHRFRIRDSRTPDFSSDFRLFLFSINVRGISTTDGPAPHKACTG